MIIIIIPLSKASSQKMSTNNVGAVNIIVVAVSLVVMIILLITMSTHLVMSVHDRGFDVDSLLAAHASEFAYDR